jgi:hypothetical protein
MLRCTRAGCGAGMGRLGILCLDFGAEDWR